MPDHQPSMKNAPEAVLSMWYWTAAPLHFVKLVRVGLFNGRSTRWEFSELVPMVMDDFGQLVRCAL